MKNFLLSTCLLLMSASALAQENVLSETWGQKLDLTIQSSETPSTWVLDSKAKQEIMMGWTCCYRKELINYVQTEHSQKLIGLKLKEKQNKLQYTLVEQYTDLQLYTFVSLQFLDIYTTYKGLQYNCVRELNPVLGEQPSVSKMFFVKSTVLIPAFQADINNEVLTKNTMRKMNMLMAVVVGNNNAVWNRAKRNCIKNS